MAGALARAGVTANAVTLAALAGSIVAGAALLFSHSRPALLLLLPSWLFARMALNAVDGMMARELSMASNRGAVLNEIADVLSDLVLYLPLAAIVEGARWPVIAFALGAVLTEFCGLLARAIGATRRYDGPMGKSDRALLAGALGLLGFLAPGSLEAWPWVFGAAAALTVLTCWNRLERALAELQR